jgi:hypothetical protein
MPFAADIMTDFYVQLWIRSLISTTPSLLKTPHSKIKSKQVVNVFMIHTNVDVITPDSQTTCVHVCSYHSSVNVSDITGIPNQSVLYTVVPFISPRCGPCNQYSVIESDLSTTASHELADVVMLESLGDLQDPAASEVGDLCAVIIFYIFNLCLLL